MNETIQVIHNAEILGKQFQIYGTFENPLFLAKDVAEWIEHSNHRAMLDSVDEDEKIKIMAPVNNPYGGYQEEEQWFLTENGVYESLMVSRKPAAKQFKKGVKQILHDYRTKGIAATPQTIEDILTSPEFGIRLLTELKQEREARAAAQAEAERQKMISSEQANQLQLQAPDVEYCQEVLAASNRHTVNSIAVHLGISAIRLNKFLVDIGWIYKQGDIYYPSHKIRDKGYCDFQIIPYLNRAGEKCTREHLKWTEAGRRAIIDLYLQKTAKGA